MNRPAVLAVLLVFTLSSIVLTGCPSKSSPTSPGGPPGTATPTFTATTQCVNINGTPCTSTNTPTITLTPTSTETPLCNPFYTFGKSAAGAFSGVFSPNLLCNRFNLSVGGRVYRVHAYLSSVPTPGTLIQGALYTDNGGAPQTLIAQSSAQTAATGWNTLDFPSTVLASGNYWIGLASNSGGVGLSYDTGSAGDARYVSAVPGSLPAVISSPASADWDFSFYADYCVIPGSPTPDPTDTPTFTPTSTPTSTPTFTETPNSSCTGSYSFGNNFSGPASVGIDNGSFASRFTLPVGGTVTALHAYILATNGRSFRMGLYSDTGSAPGTLIASSNTQAAAAGWNSASVPNTPLPAGVYWIAAANDSSGATPGPVFATEAYNNDPNDGYATFSIIPAAYGGSGPLGYSFDFYADYCVLSGSPTPRPSATLTGTPTSTPTNTPTETQTPNTACTGSYSFGTNFPLPGTGAFNATGYIFCSPATLTVTGEVNNLFFYANAAGGNVQMALYTGNGGAPQSLIAQSNQQAAVSGVNDLALPQTGPLAPGVYWIALATDSTVNLYDNDDSINNTGGYWGYGSIGSFPTAMTGMASGYTYSFYAGYCVTGGSPTPASTATWTFTPSFTPTFTPTVTETPVCATPSVFGINAVQTNSTFSGGDFFSTRFVLSGASTVTGLHAYVSSNAVSGGVTYQARMALYNDNGGAPGSLLTQSNAQPVSLGWNYFQVPGAALSAPATYWIALVHNNYGSGLGLSYSAPGSNDGYFAGMAFGPFPATAPSGSSQDWTFSFYADKCP